MSKGLVHPCLSCGACCSGFRVSFYWAESDPARGPQAVPEALTQKVNSFYACMSGTEDATKPRCVALSGTVGRAVACQIYDQRPTPCREFIASYEDGTANPRCDQVRIKHGLNALTPADWVGFVSPLNP